MADVTKDMWDAECLRRTEMERQIMLTGQLPSPEELGLKHDRPAAYLGNSSATKYKGSRRSARQ